MHRATGVGLALGGALIVWWFLAASISEEYFNLVNGLLTSLPGDLVMLGLLAAICYHFTNGIRHLIWDTGAGLENRSIDISSAIGLFTASLLLVAVLLVI